MPSSSLGAATPEQDWAVVVGCSWLRDRTVRLVERQHRLRTALLDEGRPNSVVCLAERLSSVPIITAARAEELLEATRPTAHAAVDALVGRGDLVEVTEREQDRIYEALRIFDAVYGSDDVDDGEAPDQLPLDASPDG